MGSETAGHRDGFPVCSDLPRSPCVSSRLPTKGSEHRPFRDGVPRGAAQDVSVQQRRLGARALGWYGLVWAQSGWSQDYSKIH